MTTGRHKVIELSDLDGMDWDWEARMLESVVAELAVMYHQVLGETGYVAGTPTAAQVAAVNYAKARAAELMSYDGADNLVRMTQASVYRLVADTIENGWSLDRLKTELRDDYGYSASRAESIARTETATALGAGTLESGISQGRDEKKWVTQGDELVDEFECAANAEEGWIGIHESFQSGHSSVPAHPRCRCNIITRHAPETESVTRFAEGRCPNCHALLGKDVPAGTRLYCRRCKCERTVV